MSTDDESTVGAETPELEDSRIDELERAVADLREENQRLRNRVDELEADMDSRARIEWDTEHFPDAKLVSTTDYTIPLGLIVDNSASAEKLKDLANRIRDIEDGEASVIVRSETDRDALPIENRIGRRKAGDDSLSANEKRATFVFPKFATHAESWNGKMKLSSQDVRTILAEQHANKDSDDWNTNTINRTMRKLAMLTSDNEKSDRHAKNEDNLLTLERGDKRLELVADRDEWIEFLEEAAED